MENKNKKQGIQRRNTRRQHTERDYRPAFGVRPVADYKTELGLDVLDALPLYVLLLDEDHFILHANSAVRAKLGVEPEDIIGKYCPKVIHGLDRPFNGCPLEEAVENGQAVERELYDPETGRWINSAVYPTQRLSPDGRKILLHLVTDITDRKRAEEQLRASHEQLRSLSAHLESVREEERKKIARDLHDETSQLLSSLSAHLEAAISILPANTDKVKASLRNAQTLCVNVIDQLQKLVYELRPLLLDDLGLVSAINWLIDNSLKVAGIKVHFSIAGKERRLSRQIENTIFRVVQEAISNIARHAKAENVNIKVHFKTSKIRVGLSDDGIGFDLKEAMSSKDGLRGFGLLGMKERIELINGTFNLESRPGGGGTTITIEIPLDHERPDNSTSSKVSNTIKLTS